MMPYDAELSKKASQDLNEKLKVLEHVLTSSKYLVGDHLTVADLAIASLVNGLYQFYLEEK